MSDDERLPYRVQGRWMNGSRASLCATPGRALQRLSAYRKARYKDVAVIGPDGALAEGDLHRLIIANGKWLQSAASLEAVEAELQPTA